MTTVTPEMQQQIVLMMANNLIRHAERCGMVVEIDLVNHYPLSMGNYTMRACVREQRRLPDDTGNAKGP